MSLVRTIRADCFDPRNLPRRNKGKKKEWKEDSSKWKSSLMNLALPLPKQSKRLLMTSRILRLLCEKSHHMSGLLCSIQGGKRCIFLNKRYHRGGDSKLAHDSSSLASDAERFINALSKFPSWLLPSLRKARTTSRSRAKMNDNESGGSFWTFLSMASAKYAFHKGKLYKGRSILEEFEKQKKRTPGTQKKRKPRWL